MKDYRRKKPRIIWPRQNRGPHGKRNPTGEYDHTNGVRVSAILRYFRTLNDGTSQLTTQSGSVSRTRGRVGVSLPQHAALIKSVLPATTPFTANDFIIKSKAYESKWIRKVPSTNPLAVATAHASGTFNAIYGLSFTPSTPPAFSGTAYTTAYNLAVSRLYSSLREIQSHANVGEDLGEISQTIKLLGKPMAGMQNLMRYTLSNHLSLLKRARWNNTKQIAKGLADVTLEYRFGIEPLISTFAKAYVALENRDRIANFIPFGASGKGESYSFTTPVHSALGADEIWINKITANKFKVRFKGMYSAESEIDKYALNQSLGLTWRESIPTLYNLIPYSFLLDYVINLNQFIETLAVPWGNVRWCNMTERSEQEVRIEYPAAYNNPLSDMACSWFTPGYIRTSVVGVRRSDHSSSIPFPMLQVKRPNRRQLVNTAALLAANLPVIGRLTKKLLGDKQTKDLDRHFSDINRDYKLRVPYPKFTFG